MANTNGVGKMSMKTPIQTPDGRVRLYDLRTMLAMAEKRYHSVESYSYYNYFENKQKVRTFIGISKLHATNIDVKHSIKPATLYMT